MAGWGSINPNVGANVNPWDIPSLLQEQSMEIVDQAECSKWYSEYDEAVTDNMICAGVVEDDDDHGYQVPEDQGACKVNLLLISYNPNPKVHPVGRTGAVQ